MHDCVLCYQVLTNTAWGTGLGGAKTNLQTTASYVPGLIITLVT